jgi:hypothetical protein
MDLTEAKNIILNERDAPIGRLSLAAAVVAAPENAGKVTFFDLVDCLKRGNEFKRITTIDELAALALYTRTGRPRQPNHQPYEDFDTNAENWLDYLRKNRFI